MVVAKKREVEEKEEVKREEVRTTTKKKLEGKNIAGAVTATIRYIHKACI
jgi:hypothetical protein